MAKPTTATEPTVEELRALGRARKEKPGLTPEEIADLQATYRDVRTAKDDDGKSIKRAIIAKFRRLTHGEQHPHCRRVEITVRPHPLGVPYTINEKPFAGRVEVNECVARQLAHMMATAEQVERARMREQGRIIDLDNPVAERVRQIQEA